VADSLADVVTDSVAGLVDTVADSVDTVRGLVGDAVANSFADAVIVGD
jgi:hypothetical protein